MNLETTYVKLLGHTSMQSKFQLSGASEFKMVTWKPFFHCSSLTFHWGAETVACKQRQKIATNLKGHTWSYQSMVHERIFLWKTLNGHSFLTVWASDQISKLRAMLKYQLSVETLKIDLLLSAARWRCFFWYNWTWCWHLLVLRGLEGPLNILKAKLSWEVIQPDPT